MLNNWRSSLSFSKLAFQQDDNLIATLIAKDVYKPVEYIVLDASRLRGQSTLTWVKSHFGEFGFDFDKYSMLLWPDNDAVSASEVVQHINAAIPKFASVKLISPALAHGLDEVAALTFDDSPGDADDTVSNSEFTLYF